jgi:hypothetical protein
VTSADLLDEAAAELYTADPEEFTRRRQELAGLARQAGQAAVARQIAALRKPTRSAWVINQLARSDPDAVTQLTDLGRDLRAAERARDGGAMRELAQRRRQLITALVRQALAAAGQDAATAGMREELTGTFAAAIADPEVASQLQQGTLIRAVVRAGFGSEQPVLSIVPSRPGGKQGGQARPGTARPARAKRGKAGAGRGETGAAPDEPVSGEPPSDEPGTGKTRQDRAAAAEQRRAEARAAEEQRRAEARAAQERRRAEVRAKAERAVAEADQAVAAAEADQMEQQTAIRRLERELTNARRKLRAAGAEARRAEAAQRRAHQALDRLDPPGRGEQPPGLGTDTGG